jgi:hypothetical protein
MAPKLVRVHRGITIGELANHRYRVPIQLEKAGHVKKRDRGYNAGDSSSGN